MWVHVFHQYRAIACTKRVSSRKIGQMRNIGVLGKLRRVKKNIGLDKVDWVDEDEEEEEEKEKEKKLNWLIC